MADSCKTHNKDFEFYCITHSASVCSKCAIFDHKSCSVFDLNDVSAFITVKNVATSLNARVADEITNFDTSSQQDENKFIENFTWLRENLQQIEKLTIDSFKNKRKVQYNYLQQRKTSYDSILKIVNAKIQDVANVQSRENNEDIKIAIEDLKTISETYVDELKKESENEASETQNLSVLVSLDEHVIISGVEGYVNCMKEGVQNVKQSQVSQKDTSTQTCLPYTSFSDHIPQMSEIGCTSSSCEALTFGDKNIYHGQVTQSFRNLSTIRGSPYSYPGNIQAQQPSQPMAAVHMASSYSSSSSLPVDPACIISLSPPTGVPLFFAHNSCKVFSARLPSDEEHCNVTGISFLSDGRVVLVDAKNRKIKLFNQSLKFQSEVSVDGQPYDVVQTPSGQIAVSIPQLSVVYLLDVSEILSLNTSRVIKVYKCQGLAASDTHTFVSCNNHELDSHSISIFDAQNILIKSIPLNVSNYGHLAVCPKQGHLYYKSLSVGKEKIYCMSQTGKIVWKTKVKSWNDQPYGFAAVNSGLFVSLDNIYFVADGRSQWKRVAEMHFSGPLSVTKDMRRIAVAGRSGGPAHTEDSVSVFTITYSEQ